MATITPIKVVPPTRIDNSIIDDMARIGIYDTAVNLTWQCHFVC